MLPIPKGRMSSGRAAGDRTHEPAREAGASRSDVRPGRRNGPGTPPSPRDRDERPRAARQPRHPSGRAPRTVYSAVPATRSTTAVTQAACSPAGRTGHAHTGTSVPRALTDPMYTALT